MFAFLCSVIVGVRSELGGMFSHRLRELQKVPLEPIIGIEKWISRSQPRMVMNRAMCFIWLGINFALFGTTVNAQNESYSDVLVVVNSNSPISDSIGSYFALHRNIPSSNIVRINVPSTEEIDSLQFENLRSQLEQVILSRNLRNTINYIVTTKGVPLKVLRGNPFTCSSVESELTLILGTYAGSIGGNGCIMSPYYERQENFSRAKFGIYLVTRLDGYSFDDVKGIIDRASTSTASSIAMAKFVLDEDPLWTPTAGFLNLNMLQASQTLQSENVLAVLDTTTLFMTHQSSVLGYVSWGSNDHNPSVNSSHAVPCNSYLPGAIAETYVSTSARTFSTPQVYGQSLVADLVKEGMTGAKGYVYEPYASSMACVELLFPMYVAGYTMAESFYSSSPYLSWMDVIIGDPKCRLKTSRIPPPVLPVYLASFTAIPRGAAVELQWTTTGETNSYGFEIERTAIAAAPVSGAGECWQKIGFLLSKGGTNATENYSYADYVTPGVYGYRLKQIDRSGKYQFSPQVEAVVQLSANDFELSQNYPNPFNPSTRIDFALKTPGTATLKVFNDAGQEVKTLFSGRAEKGQSYSVVFDAANLTSGTYFYVFETAGKREVKKMLLLK